MQSQYDREMAKPMWQELANIGVRPLTTPEEVDETLTKTEGSTLLVVNSVCGCAAGNARPGVAPVHLIGVHDPCHAPGGGIYVRGAYILLRPYEYGYLGGVTPCQPFQLRE